MPKKDVCYVNTSALEPKYLSGQIISIKEPDSEWSDIECGKREPENSNMRFAVKTLVVANNKLSLLGENRLVIIKKNGKDFVDVRPRFIPEK
tara:strand:- start:264 stop:539 length:276 start_codon:yes stop_codon:yes gene_type:complete